jgi:hypothetical protein
MIVLRRFSTAFAPIEGFKAEQVWVSLTETSKDRNDKGISPGRNAAD